VHQIFKQCACVFQLENPESTANTMKKSVSSFLDQVSSVLNPLPDDEDEALMIVGSDTIKLSRLQVIILQCPHVVWCVWKC